MSPLDLLLYSLALVPLLIVVAVLVNLVANNHAVTKLQAQQGIYPTKRARGKR